MDSITVGSFVTFLASFGGGFMLVWGIMDRDPSARRIGYILLAVAGLVGWATAVTAVT